MLSINQQEPKQKINSPESFFHALLEFFQNHMLLLITVYIIAFGIWGSWISKDIVTFDEEGLFSTDGQAAWYGQWFALGRWFFVYLKKLMNVYAINTYYSKAIFLIGFPLVSLLWLFCLEQWGGKQNKLSEIVFCLIFISHPIWATQFSYRIQIEVMTITMIALAAGVYLLVRWLETGNLFLCFGSLIIITCCFGSYQAHMFFYADAIAIWLFLDSMCNKNIDFNKLRGRFLRLSIFTIAAFVLWRIIAIKTGYQTNLPYLAEQFRWGKDPAGKCIASILTSLKNSMFGNGNVYNSIYGIVTILFAGHLICQIFKNGSKAIWSFLTGMMIIFIPYLLEFVTASGVVIRSRHAFVFSCAFMAAHDIKWLFSFARNITQKYKTLYKLSIAIFCLMMIASEAQITTRLLYTHARVMREDYMNLYTIYERAMQLGAEKGYALVILGSQSNFSDITLMESEVIGFSYLEFTGLINYEPETDSYSNTRKVPDAMRAYGFDVTIPTTEQINQAKLILPEMNRWPMEGSVKVVREYKIIVVKV